MNISQLKFQTVIITKIFQLHMSVISGEYSSSECNGRCNNNHSKLLQRKQNQYKKEKGLLEQKIEFLEQELSEYRQREQDTKKINQSIMITYQQNENLREQNASKSIKMLKERHEEEIRRIKEQHFKEIKRLEEGMAEYRDKYEQVLVDMDRNKLDCDRKVAEARKNSDAVIRKTIEEKEIEYENQIGLLEIKVKQAESAAELYRDYAQKRKDYEQEEEEESGIRASVRRGVERGSSSRKQNSIGKYELRNQHQQINASYLRGSRESVKMITSKINRAVHQLRGSSSSSNQRLHERINAKLQERGKISYQ